MSFPLGRPALGGGGRRRAAPARRRRSAPRKRASPRGGGGGGRARQYYDKDVLLQEFNHTGVFDMNASEVDKCVKDVVIPLVSRNMKALFNETTGSSQHRTLSHILSKNGLEIPSLAEAKRSLQATVEQCAQLQQHWVRGQYSTITSAQAAVGGFSVHSTFAAVAVVLDNYSKLETQDCKMVVSALLMCTLLNHAQLEAHEVSRWRSQLALDGGGAHTVIAHSQLGKKRDRLREHQKQLQHELGKVRGMHQQMISRLASGGRGKAAGGAEPGPDPVAVSRNLLVLEAVRRTKQSRADQLAAIQDQLQAAIASGGKPAPPSAAAARAESESEPEAAAEAPAPPAAEESEAAGGGGEASGTIASSVLAAEAEESNTVLDNENVRLFWGGGAARDEMTDRVLMIKDAGGEGVNMYAYIDQENMKVNFMLEELAKLRSQDVEEKTQKRIKYVLKNGHDIGKWVQADVNDSNRADLQKFMVQMAKSTDDELAAEVAKVIPAGGVG